MKFLLDFFPVILFFVAFKLAGIFVATGVAIAATAAQIGFSLVRRHRVPPMQWASLAIIGVFGGATLLLRDETFIKWKPTVLYWVLAAVFLGGLAFRRNLVKSLMSENLPLPDPVWWRLCVAWGVFFAALGGVNLYVAEHFSTGAWVNFKLFGALGLMLAFLVAQGFWISRYIPDEEPGSHPGAGGPPKG